MKQKIRLGKFSITLIILAGLFLGWGRWIAYQASLYQGERGPELRRELGFGVGSPYIQTGDRRTEVFTIYPVADSVMETAGFRNGDIVLSTSITRFYKLLYHSRGKSVTVEVVKGGNGVALDQRKLRVITFMVPK